MAWKLQFDQKIQEYFLHGKDNLRRLELHHTIIEEATNKKDVVNLQVGVAHNVDHKYGANWLSIDLYDKRPCIDYNMDLSNLKFPSDMFNLIICNAVLEHCKNPFLCASELYRVCKPGGKIWVEVPYVQYYHPFKNYNEERDGILCDLQSDLKDDQEHGGHYFNFTPQGITEVMKPFKMEEILLINEGGIAYLGVKE
jgi:SAM-dependent methyltransferase